MTALINKLKALSGNYEKLPFSVYSSYKEQKLLNVPISKPTLIAILNGKKKLEGNEATCKSGEFIFLSDSSSVHMRNIPEGNNYCAMLIEFNETDFPVQESKVSSKNYYVGELSPVMEKSLSQFVEFCDWAPPKLFEIRKREIIEILIHSGHKEVLNLAKNNAVSSQIQRMYAEIEYSEFTLKTVCDELAMSESTLRRRLKSEGTNFQEIKDQMRLGLGLHLLQSTDKAVSIIADNCGYQSPSKFSLKFKERFGLTPSDLRRTKLAD